MSSSVSVMKIATGLAALRKSRRITQQRLAETIGTNRVTIARIETGTAIPSWQFLNKAAQALGAEVEITFRSIDREDTGLLLDQPDGQEYICINCQYHWTSRLERSVMQCPQCRKRQGVLFSEYTKALQAFQNITEEIKRSPPFKKLPPVRGISRYAPQTVALLLKTVGTTFPSPKLPLGLLFRIAEQTGKKKTEESPAARGRTSAEPKAIS